MTPPEPAPCPGGGAALHAFVDGELDAVHALGVEEHLAGCAACAAEVAAIRAGRDRLRREPVGWRAPDHLRAQILDALAREDAPARGWRPGAARLLDRVGRWGLIPSAAALAAALVLTFGVPRTAATLQEELVADHVRSLLVDHLTDVATSDRHTVKPWFGGKIDFAPPVVDLAGRGFPLVGGRVDYLGGRVVAALVYRRAGHVINLFVWPDPSPAGRPASRDGFALLPWSAAGLRFVAVSDLAEPELDRFRALFTTAADGASEPGAP